MHRLRVILLLLLASASLARADSKQDMDRCRDRSERDLDAVLRSCTAAINSIKLSREDLAYAFFERGVIYSVKGKYDLAIEEFSDATHVKPDYTLAFNNRGMAYEKKGDYDRAIQDYDVAVRLAPIGDYTAWVTRQNRARTKESKGDYDGAIQDYSEIIRLVPSDAGFWHYRGNAKSKKGDLSGAIQDYDEAIRLSPNFAEAWYDRGLAKQKIGDTAGAAADMARGQQLNPKLASPSSAAGGTGPPQPKYTQEQVEEIRKENEKTAKMNALISQAKSAMEAKNWQDAVAPLQQLTTMDPTDWQLYSGLGYAYLNLGQYEQAVAAYQKGIQAADNAAVGPGNPASDPARKKAGVAQMLTNEGNAHLKLHQNKEAVACYTRAASLDPNPATAYFNLCATQYNTGEVQGALEACERAIAADPNKADAWFIKGSLLIAGSKTDKSGRVIAPAGCAEALNKYLELAPNGVHADEVKQMLAYIGSKVAANYQPK